MSTQKLVFAVLWGLGIIAGWQLADMLFKPVADAPDAKPAKPPEPAKAPVEKAQPVEPAQPIEPAKPEK